MAVSLNVHNTTISGLGLRPMGGTQNYIDVARIALDDMRFDLRSTRSTSRRWLSPAATSRHG